MEHADLQWNKGVWLSSSKQSWMLWTSSNYVSRSDASSLCPMGHIQFFGCPWAAPVKSIGNHELNVKTFTSCTQYNYAAFILKATDNLAWSLLCRCVYVPFTAGEQTLTGDVSQLLLLKDVHVTKERFMQTVEYLTRYGLRSIYSLKSKVKQCA